jgi:hypothetical protein
MWQNSYVSMKSTTAHWDETIVKLPSDAVEAMRSSWLAGCRSDRRGSSRLKAGHVICSILTPAHFRRISLQK